VSFIVELVRGNVQLDNADHHFTNPRRMCVRLCDLMLWHCTYQRATAGTYASRKTAIKDVRPFSEILELWKRASAELHRKGDAESLSVESVDFFREYGERVGASYSKRWPRPWPCGAVWLKWDPRWVEPVSYTLNPSNGLFTVDLKIKTLTARERTAKLAAFVDRESGHISVESEAIPELSVIYSPEIDGFHAGPFDAGHIEAHPDQLPRPTLKHEVGSDAAHFSCFQYFPAIGPSKEHPNPPRSDKDRNFGLYGRISGDWTPSHIESSGSLLFSAKSETLVRLDITVATPRDLLLRRLEAERPREAPASWITISQTHAYSEEELDTAAFAERSVSTNSKIPFQELQQRSQQQWREFWSASAVTFEDKTLERIWYHNQYFLACCLRKHRTAPGLFANWSAGDIGSAWHSDYHLDYNCQQVYWGVFSSNHVDMHQPYLELVENLLPMSERTAREGFNLPGAFFPLSAYPVPSQIVPYPVPPWGYQICMTPWAVQSLWWQYLYTQDLEYLKRVYPTIRAAARFLAAFVTKEEDGRYHIFPSISSENWGCTVDFKLNKDCILDLALTRFVLDAMVTASTILGQDEQERRRWKEISDNLAPYPGSQGPHGAVWLDIVNAPAEHIYNVPITLAPVLPGEQVGIDKGVEFLEIATRTAQTIRLEGGNDLVSQPLIRARLGMLDFAWFKGQIEYCMLPDGASNDRVRQSGGRYSLSTDFDFMMRMGLWCENFAVPMVLNECMMQSYTGTIRLFPNVISLEAARFDNLRAVGAFLVSAAFDGKSVTRFEVLSERGAPLRFISPWKQKPIRVVRSSDGKHIPAQRAADTWTVATEPGERYSISIG
jgi:alpha-L-fucosidase 2